MPIYRIADLNVEVNPKFKICRKRLESYAVKSNVSGKTDIAISGSDDEIRERLRLSDNLSEQGAEDVLILSKFCNAVLDGFDGFFFHSSCLELDGEGYVFSAVSRTGKSFFFFLWRTLDYIFMPLPFFFCGFSCCCCWRASFGLV